QSLWDTGSPLSRGRRRSVWLLTTHYLLSPPTTHRIHHSRLRIHHLVAQHADAGDLDLEHIAGLHPQLRTAAMADAFGRAGRDHVAGRERGEVGAEGDDVRN